MMDAVGIWLYFWTLLLIFAVTVFAGLAVAVTFGGLIDIRCMFRAIEAEQRELDEPGGEEER
jgi:hypothetical protein